MTIKRKVKKGQCIFEKGRRYNAGDVFPLDEKDIPRFAKKLEDYDEEAEAKAAYEKMDQFERAIFDQLKAEKEKQAKAEAEKALAAKAVKKQKRADKGNLNRMQTDGEDRAS